MNQSTLNFGLPTNFDGQTYDPARDSERMTPHLERVLRFMLDGKRHTIPEVAQAAGCSHAAASARIRDLRKAKFGAHDVRSEYVAKGLWHYWIVSPQQS